MHNLLLEVQILLEKAKQYPLDYVNIQSWKSIVNYLLDIKNIENTIVDNYFPNYIADMIYTSIDSFSEIQGLSQESLIKLNDLLTEIFDLLTENDNASKIISDLQNLLVLLDTISNEIVPPGEQVSASNPDGTDAEAPANTLVDTDPDAIEDPNATEDPEVVN